MSGYRSLHREQVLNENVAIWSCQATPPFSKCTNNNSSETPIWRIWTGNSDGTVRTYLAHPPSLGSYDNCNENGSDGRQQPQPLTAAALALPCTHVLTGIKQQIKSSTILDGSNIQSVLGCAVVHIIRNYAGEDNHAGEFIVASLEMSGTVRIWKFPEDWDDTNVQQNQPIVVAKTPCIPCLVEFNVEGATGTTLQVASPRIMQSIQDVVVAVGCLNGTVAIVATGIPVPNATIEPSVAGMVIDTWGSQGSAMPLRIAWHPTQMKTLVVGRQDGIVDIVSSNRQKQHRLLQLHHSPCRAVAITPDGNLLVAGNDAGMLGVWDLQRSMPILVHHLLHAHTSWILDVVCLSDCRRFVSVGAERQIHVWSAGQMAQNQPLHTFQLDRSVWTVHVLPSYNKDQSTKLVTGSDTGLIQIFLLGKLN